MERTGVYNGKRQRKVFVYKLKHTHSCTNQERKPYQTCHKPVKCIFRCWLLSSFYCFLNLLIYGENIIIKVKIDFVYSIACFSRLQRHKGHAEMITRIDFSVHYKTIEKRILGYNSQSACNNNAHMAHIDALLAAFPDIVLHQP